MPLVWNNPEVSLDLSKLELRPLSFEDMAKQGERCSEILFKVRKAMLSPDSEKKPPVFSADVLAGLCGITKASLDYRIKNLLKPDSKEAMKLPTGTIERKGAPRRFSLQEARQWVKACRPQPPRQPGEEALVVAVINSKGGVAKTSTSFTLAQSLALRGLDVLVLDADPQASATTLTGTVPERDIDMEQTIVPFVFGEKPDLRYAVQTTYWDGLDMIPSSSLAYNAEMRIGSASAQGHALLWDYFIRGLAPLRSDYDAIIIDTSPALAYSTINAVFAADGLIVPSPPNAIDFAAGAQFWTLLGDLVHTIGEKVGESLKEKRWQFVYVLPTHADPSSQSYPVVREWMAETYGNKMFPGEILSSKVAQTLSAEFATVYDVGGRYEGNMNSYRRLRDGYDRLGEVMDYTLMNVHETARTARKVA